MIQKAEIPKDIFCIKTVNDTLGFIGNKKTGRWVLSNSPTASLITNLSHPSPCKKIYKGISTILLNVTRECNFNCKYCLIGQKKSDEKLPIEIGKKAIDRVSEINKNDRYVLFHGSEPMLNFEVIKQLVEYSNKKRYGLRFAIQSNGSLFEEKSIEFLTENKVNIGISLDGLEKHQNTTRQYSNGKNSYDDVLRNIHRVAIKQGGIGVITVVTQNNVDDLLEIVEHFENEGIDAVSFCPVSHKNKKLFPNPTKLATNLIKIFDRYLKAKLDGIETIRIENIRKHLLCLIPRNSYSTCIQCSLGAKYPLIGIDIDGKLYPCDFFWGDEKYQMGNIFDHSLTDILNAPNDFRKLRNTNDLRNCSSCDWEKFCGGGCPGTSYMDNGTVLDDYRYCKINKNIFNYLASKMPILHDNGLINEILLQ